MTDVVEPLVRIEREGRVATITLNRPEALNSFNETMYDAATNALRELADDMTVAVAIVTGAGRAFSSGADLIELAGRNAGNFVAGRHGFPGYLNALVEFPKPLICAVNGMAIGIGATMLAFADLVVMSNTARLRYPFTSLGVVPEAASSFMLPRLVGHQNAAWMLMSSEWITASQAHEFGVAFKVCEPNELMDVTRGLAAVLASKPISSLIGTKATLVASLRESIDAAGKREGQWFAQLLGKPANNEALRAFAERRPPDFASIND